VSTNLTEQISRRFPGGISGKIQDMFVLLQDDTQCTKSTSLPTYRTKTWYAQHRAKAKIKKGDQFLEELIWYPAQFYHHWKPMQSLIDMLHKNFQEDHTNSRRFPGVFLNSSRFPGFTGVVDTLSKVATYKDISRCAKNRSKNRWFSTDEGLWQRPIRSGKK